MSLPQCCEWLDCRRMVEPIDDNYVLAGTFGDGSKIMCEAHSDLVHFIRYSPSQY